MNIVPFFDHEESLILSPHCQAGLILQGRLYNDLICPGSSLSCSSEFGFISAYAIGKAELGVVATLAERRQARQRRIDSIHRLQRILLQPNELERACLIVNLLCHWFGMAEARQIPLSLITPLVSISCETLKQAWQRYEVSLADQTTQHCLRNPYHLSWRRAQNGGYSGHRKSPINKESAPPPGSLQVERLLHTALVSGELTSDSEGLIDQAFGGQNLTDREIDLLVTLKDAIAAGSVKQVTSSDQTAETFSASPYRIFCSASG